MTCFWLPSQKRPAEHRQGLLSVLRPKSPICASRGSRGNSLDAAAGTAEGGQIMNDLHEMVYKKSRCEPQVLAHGVYHGRNYYVVSFGTHPCAYVDVSDLLSMTRKEQNI